MQTFQPKNGQGRSSSEQRLLSVRSRPPFLEECEDTKGEKLEQRGPRTQSPELPRSPLEGRPLPRPSHIHCTWGQQPHYCLGAGPDDPPRPPLLLRSQVIRGPAFEEDQNLLTTNRTLPHSGLSFLLGPTHDGLPCFLSLSNSGPASCLPLSPLSETTPDV